MFDALIHHQILLLSVAMLAAGCSSNAMMPVAPQPGPVEMVSDGIVIPVKSGLVKLQVRGPGIIRVLFASDRGFFARPSLVVLPADAKEKPFFHLVQDAAGPGIDTGVIRAVVALDSGRVSFFDHQGHLLRQEDSRQIEPAKVLDQKTSHVLQTWKMKEGESLYGLGQHQFDDLNIAGLSIDLWQRNTSIVVPLLVSSEGHGILWDNLSYSRFGDRAPWQSFGGAMFADSDGKTGGLSGTYFSGEHFDRPVAKRIDDKIDLDVSTNRDLLSPAGELVNHPTAPPASSPSASQPARHRALPVNTAIHPDLPPGAISIKWDGTFIPKKTGDYQFHSFSNGAIQLTIGDAMIFDHWRQSWLSAEDVKKIHLEAGRRYPLHLQWVKDIGADVFKVEFKPPVEEALPIALWSEVGEGIDYYFIYGPTIDKVVAGMRQLTGHANMMPIWAFGLWQSRQRYETQQASVDVIDGFRKRKIPFDNIVQDWQYWRRDQWGSHDFDQQRFPDPVGWINAIHDRHANLMISVWGKFYKGTENYDRLLQKGFLYPLNIELNTKDFIGFPFTNYDAFNPAARQMFWSMMKEKLFDKGVDAWWMDATEPDIEATPTLAGMHFRMNPTGAGPGPSVLNGYALENARAVYEGQRSAAPNQRVFNLTRNGYAGQQRYSAASWSGDITCSWSAMRKQIPAGLGFCISGVPYWTMDSGGFVVPPRFSRHDPDPQDVEEWRELNTRWFEFATFVPLLRVHGEFPHREMWEFGGESSPAFQAMLKFDRLRYRLLPYIYSSAGEITRSGGSMMRALVFDFPDDKTARNLNDEYLFGSEFLVSPVTTYKARTRSVYLPQGSLWYDFWKGNAVPGGQQIEAEAPYDAIPLHVKAGSIIPFGPELQYTTEKTADPITLFVYTGADGNFTLYEDDGLTYDYEQNLFSEIPINWDEKRRVLTIGNRHGNFPQMLKKRKFQIVFVGPKNGVPFSFDPKPDQTIEYRGEAVTVHQNTADSGG